ncbi:MAG: aspartate--tRNA ligase [Firmicutes bacterium]|nr:aspartate--tRNA ligase [Bacillota bacterium]
MYRTKNCNELTSVHVGETVVLAGWIDTVRDHGGVTFVDLRDHYGVTQVVFSDENVNLPSKESVISVTGTVRERTSDTVNPKLATGRVELKAQSIEVLSPAPAKLPFEVGASDATREDLRLKYRFLDLRNPRVHANMVLRSRITSFIRSQMERMGFLEIQTPILTASSPEGARDYLVPSRKHHGKFYALPQAPQQFKQLLMTSGFDKYFQIAPCFRDEDARADRSPGEFYQVDFEMAFATQEDVLKVGETLLSKVFKKFGAGKKISKTPFRRIPYAESMLTYGTDKPDLRNPLLIRDLSDFFKSVDFAPFKSKPVRGIAVADCALQSKSFFEKMLEFALSIGMKGLGYIARHNDGLKGPIVKFLSEPQQQELLKRFNLKPNGVLFFISDGADTVDKLAGQIRTELAQRLNLIDTSRFEFCYIVDYPMYGLNPETGQIEFTHNPFSMPQGELSALWDKDPLQILAYQYDIVCNGVELSSGAVRNHKPDVMKKAFQLAGYTEDDLRQKFPALYEAFHYGAPPHAGMAPGLDRIVMLLSSQENIREVIAFPFNANAQDLLLGAPGEVSEQQLREAHIKIR